LSVLFLLVYILIGVAFAGFCIYLDQQDYGFGIVYVIMWPVMLPLVVVSIVIYWIGELRHKANISK